MTFEQWWTRGGVQRDLRLVAAEIWEAATAAERQRRLGVADPAADVRWAVMVGGEMFPGSLSLTREGADSYLPDARGSVATTPVRLVRVTIEGDR
jgi:hypothetical protein